MKLNNHHRIFNEVVLGVDGGSTKTHMAVAEKGGRLLAFEGGPGTNHEGLGYPRCAAVLRKMFSRACRRAGIRAGDIKTACFGMCGGDLPEDFREIRDRMALPMGLKCPVKVHNDAFLPIYNDGWRERGVGITCGGWHKWVGVKGGLWFMQEGRLHPGLRHLAIEEIFMVYEGFTPPSGFAAGLARWLGFTGVNDFMLRRHYGGGKRPFIRPAPKDGGRMLHIPQYVGRAAARGSKGALRVLDRYAAFSAEGVGAVARRLGLSGRPFDVILSGSIHAGIPALRRAVRRRLRAVEPRANVIPARFLPVRGALVWAAHAAWGGLPKGALMERVLRYGLPK